MQEYKPLVSIIIPVYNAQKYLTKCIKSVLKQSYENFEIICVDDCSTDKSLRIIEKLSSKDLRIRLLKNKSNIGAGLSRNIGVDNAKGDYILFLDSDDWLEKNALEILISYIESDKSIDFINYGLNLYNAQGNIKYGKITFPKKYINQTQFLYNTPEIADFIDFKIKVFIKTKLIKTSNIKFNDNLTFEDVEYTLKLLLYAKSILFINETIYNYRTLVKNSVSSRIYNYSEYHSKYLDFVKQNFHNDEIKNRLLRNLYKIFIESCIKTYFYKNISYNDFRQIIENNIDLSILSDMPTKYYMHIYTNLLNLAENDFRKKYLFKFFIKTHFSLLFLIYLNLKRNLFSK